MSEPIQVGDSYVRDYGDKVVETTVDKVFVVEGLKFTTTYVRCSSKVISGQDWIWQDEKPHNFSREYDAEEWHLKCKFAKELNGGE
tara:strand:+ start:45 stop:302 length:258 start_codon:yes stop_codon:yes gene_type:complete